MDSTVTVLASKQGQELLLPLNNGTEGKELESSVEEDAAPFSHIRLPAPADEAAEDQSKGAEVTSPTADRPDSPAAATLESPPPRIVSVQSEAATANGAVLEKESEEKEAEKEDVAAEENVKTAIEMEETGVDEEEEVEDLENGVDAADADDERARDGEDGEEDEDVVVLEDDGVDDEIEEIGEDDGEVGDIDENGSISGASLEGLGEVLRRESSLQIAERRAQEAQEPEFARHLALVRRLEHADGCFVCTSCPSEEVFACWDVRQLVDHLLAIHKEDAPSHACTYCSQLVLLSRLEGHVNRHLQQDSTARFACPLCPAASFHSNTLHEQRLHLRSRHGLLTAASPSGPPVSCANCKRRFPSCEALFRHLEAATHSVCHCAAAGCLVKSRNRRALLDHQRRKHPKLGAGLLVTTELSCADTQSPGSTATTAAAVGSTTLARGGSDDCSSDIAPVAASADVEILPGPPLGAEEDASSLGGTEVSMAGPTHSLGSGVGLAESSCGLNTCLPSSTPPGHVFCLRCPYCRLSTIRWPKFLRHQVTCPSAGSGGFFHRLFFCSECLAVSTERQLLVDHISAEHVSAQLIEEEVLTTASRSLERPGSAERAMTGADRPPSFRMEPALTASPALVSASTPKPAGVSPVAQSPSPGELVSFPFDEEKFRDQCGAQHDPVEVDRVLEKMRRFCAYSVRILGKENHRRIPQCPECHKAFPYGLGDFKRHLMTVHLDVPREFIRDCLHFTQLPKGEEKFNELQEQLAMRNFRPKVIEPGRKRIPLPFSVKVLRKLTETLSRDAQEYLVQKMKLYSTKWALVDSRSTNKKYRCGLCSYASAHALADVRKHILGSHCGISTKHFRFCLQSSRLDPISFTLLSEDKLLRLANHTRRLVGPSHRAGHLAIRRLGYMRHHRLPAGGLFATSTTSSALRLGLAGLGPEGGKAGGTEGVGSGSGNGGSEEDLRDRGGRDTVEEDEDTGIEGETAAEEEDENEARDGRASPQPIPLTVPSSLGPCVFPGSLSTPTGPPTITTTAGEEIPLPQVLPSLIPASGLLGLAAAAAGDGGLPSLPPPLPPPVSSHSFLSGSSPSHLSYIPRQRNVDCFSVPNGVDFEEVIRLPFSEVVLRRLLAGTCDSSTEEMIVERMHVYSSYELIRMATGSRTLAFKCRCNRIFNTSRLPGRRMRPSTLADTRRHVMGVHARIPHEYLTVCCQASRISRENNWALYSDDMLLKLAADRPTKLMISRSSDDGSGGHHTAPRVSRVAPVPASAWAAPSPATSSSVASPSERSNGQVKSEPNDADPPVFALRLEPHAAQMQHGHHDLRSGLRGDIDRNDMIEDVPLPVESPSSSAAAADEDPTAYLRVEQASNNVDRIISLPYSMEALRYLTDGYCHPDYLETLRSKMDSYSSYKVYVTRRSGRRFFCCSGCSASSPHGLGDIRKHIVGVHAKVPERYKAAAMHCSRLSREDNSLLPLNVLLQLSKMKWRGTVIQPIGGRNSLPPSLMSSLAVGPSSSLQDFPAVSKAAPVVIPEPPPPPPPPKPPSPGADASGSGEESYSGGDSLQDPPACPPPTNGMSLVVPPHLYIHKSRGKFGEVVYNCSVCRVSNRNIGPVRGHIVRDHMGLPGHKCFICAKLYNTKNDVLLHHKVVHSRQEFRLSQYSPYRYAMARVCLRSDGGGGAGSGGGSGGGGGGGGTGANDSSNGLLSTPSVGPTSSIVMSGSSSRMKKRRMKDLRDGGAPAPKRRSLGPSATGTLYPPGFSTATFPMPPPKADSSEQCYIVRRKGGYLGVTFSCNVCGAKAADWDRTRAHVALFHLGCMPFHCPQCGLEHWDHVAMAEHLRDGHQLEREAAILMNCLDATPRPGAYASNPEFERTMSQIKMVNQRHSGAT